MEFETMTETSDSACIGKDVNTREVRSISPASKIVKNSTGRKSFSKRRSTCFDSLANTGSTNGQNTENRSAGVQEGEAASTSVEKCMQKFKYEKEAWQVLCEERKQKYKEVKMHSSCKPLHLDWENCADILLDEDKQFLNDQPEYENTVSKMNRVAEMAAICMHIKHESARTSTGITEMAEQQAAAVKKKILKHAESYFT